MPGLSDVLNGGLSGAIDDVTGQAGDSNSFSKVLTEVDLVDDGVSYTAGEYVKTGAFTVPAQEQYHWGQGAAKHPDNQGYIYFDVNTATPTDIEGVLRVQQRDAQERNIITVMEQRTNVLAGSQTDRKQKQAFPLQDQYPRVGRDSKLNLAINADSTATVSQSDSEVLMPVTVYPV